MFMEFVQDQMFLFVALAMVSVMLVYSYFDDRLAGIQTIGADEAVRVFNRDAWVLDVRSEAEYKTGYIGEAENIVSSDVPKQLDKIMVHKDEEVLVYCQSGARSSAVAGRLAKAGFSKVYNLRGGILAWRTAGLPVNMPQSKKQRRKSA